MVLFSIDGSESIAYQAETVFPVWCNVFWLFETIFYCISSALLSITVLRISIHFQALKTLCLSLEPFYRFMLISWKKRKTQYTFLKYKTYFFIEIFSALFLDYNCLNFLQCGNSFNIFLWFRSVFFPQTFKRMEFRSQSSEWYLHSDCASSKQF